MFREHLPELMFDKVTSNKDYNSLSKKVKTDLKIKYNKKYMQSIVKGKKKRKDRKVKDVEDPEEVAKEESSSSEEEEEVKPKSKRVSKRKSKK